MKRTLLAALVIGLVAGADDKKDRYPLKGTWSIASAVRNGKANENAVGGTVAFDGEKVFIKTKDGEHKGTYKLQPGEKPGHIDLTPGDGPEAGKVMLGIYSLKDDELKICFADPDQERPKGFEAKEGSEHHLVTLKRAK
jgi:uncharacterized protein (TIGR03067 family)